MFLVHFDAPLRRKVAVELPEEALEDEERGLDLVGALEMSLYGARDATINFQREVVKFM